MSDTSVRNKGPKETREFLEKVRSYAAGIGMESAPAEITQAEELRYYFTQLMFGMSLRMEAIAAKIKNRSADEIKIFVASEQPHISEELKLCSDIFHALLPGPTPR